ncbi:MAG: metallopeptidase family protein [Planctomycetota bacterium]
MTDEQRERFDAMVAAVIDGLPAGVQRVLDEVSVTVLDRPTPVMLAELGMSEADADDVCGLHTGVGLTERGIEDQPMAPDVIHLFRFGTVRVARGWHGPDADARIGEEIRITLLHEIGHHFGLDETDLDDLGYG